GGPRLLYALQNSHGFASVSTVLRKQPIPRLLPSIGTPERKEIDSNISSFFAPEIKLAPSYPGCSEPPGNTLMVDGVAIEPKCRFCYRRNAILGLCREHAKHVNTQVNSVESVDLVRSALAETDKDSGTRVCFGTDATVVAVAPFCNEEHYTAIPIVVSPTDKTESAEDFVKWLRVVLEAWKEHPEGEALHGPIWRIASDGDSIFRLAKFILCMTQEI
ncbi:hypothetical protein FB45DRAFT_696231, partial [Roridomyces roridus]